MKGLRTLYLRLLLVGMIAPVLTGCRDAEPESKVKPTEVPIPKAEQSASDRLRRAASAEEEIAASLIASINDLMGMSVDELGPAEKAILEDLSKKQLGIAEEIQLLIGDLANEAKQGNSANQEKLLTDMEDSGVVTALKKHSDTIGANRAYKAVHVTREWAKKLRQWAIDLDKANGA